jgi:hypothetical protein
VKHSLKNSGDTLIRQICFFPSDPAKRCRSRRRRAGYPWPRSRDLALAECASSPYS